MKKQKFIGFSVLLLSLIFLFMSAALPIDSRNFNSSPRTLPLLVSAVMVIFSAGHLLFPSFSIEPATINKKVMFRVLIFLSVILAYTLIIEKIGYVASTFALAMLSSMMMGIRGYKQTLCFSLILSLGTWLLFTKAFSAYLPSGTLF